MIKRLLIVSLALALVAALFLTRPTKADFETYVRDNTKIVDGKPTGGPTIADKVKDQLKSFASEQSNKSAADLYLEQCTFENRLLWTNVKIDGKPVYLGAVGHWFERGE